MKRIVMDAALAHSNQIARTAQHARRRAADLHMSFLADRLKLKHRVEGRDFKRADIGHVQHVCDVADRCLGEPAALLLLRAPHDRDHGRGLTSLRILRNLLVCPSEILPRKREARGLYFFRGQTTDGHQFSLSNTRRIKCSGCDGIRHHRSTSPNTMSSEPNIAETSASRCPLQMKSIACKCANPGARILHLYGLLEPSETR